MQANASFHTDRRSFQKSKPGPIHDSHHFFPAACLIASRSVLPSTFASRPSHERLFRAVHTVGRPPPVSVKIRCIEYLTRSGKSASRCWYAVSRVTTGQRSFADVAAALCAARSSSEGTHFICTAYLKT